MLTFSLTGDLRMTEIPQTLVSFEPIQISGPFGPMTIQGFRYRELAVHGTLSDREFWTISHLPTGLSFGFRWTEARLAIGAMLALAELRSNWRCHAQDIERTVGVYEILIAHGGRRYGTTPRVATAPGDLNGYKSLR